jgi:transposase
LFNKKESKMSNIKPPYSAQFRQQMVELAQAGRSASELSREFGPHVTSILNWVRKAKEPDDSPMGAQPPLNASERQELVALRRRVKQLQVERDILSKATAWFAGKSEPTLTPSTR